MEQQGNNDQGMGMPFSMNPYEPNQPAPDGSTHPMNISSAQIPQLAYQQFHQQPEQQLQLQLQTFWDRKHEEVQHTTNFKKQSLPLKRIKKIMKSDEDVRCMISSEAPVVFAKACAMFIEELTLRAWNETEEKMWRTLRRDDVITATPKTDVFDFLVDIVPGDNVEDVTEASDGAGGSGCGGGLLPPVMPPPAEGLPYYYMAGQPQMGAPLGMFVDPTVYGQPSFMAPPAWPQPPLPPPPPADGC